MMLIGKPFRIALLLGLGGAMAMPAHAFMNQRIEAKVPFRFQVEDQAFAPGQYVIQPLDASNPAVLEVRKADGSARAIVVTQSLTCDHVQESPQLVFNKRGKTRVLRAVYGAGTATGAALSDAPVAPPQVARATAAKRPASAHKVAAVKKEPPCGVEPAATVTKTASR